MNKYKLIIISVIILMCTCLTVLICKYVFSDNVWNNNSGEISEANGETVLELTLPKAIEDIFYPEAFTKPFEDFLNSK